jgi:prolyl-tRNA editing enzyme YbaK/EbsC (Cys-tRNA(Pro) deacylase)
MEYGCPNNKEFHGHFKKVETTAEKAGGPKKRTFQTLIFNVNSEKAKKLTHLIL